MSAVRYFRSGCAPTSGAPAVKRKLLRFMRMALDFQMIQ
jgi:hypothetical protein